jgi:hypothetical protein
MIMLLNSLRNGLDYPLRRLLRWRRKGLTIPNEDKTNLFAHLSAVDRLTAEATAEKLRSDYHLDDFYHHSRAGNYRENLFYLEMLARALDSIPAELPSTMRAADVGPSHWFYVQALSHLLQYWRHPETPRQVRLEAFETDPYRVYTDLYSRMDHALAHIRGAGGVSYHPSGLTRQTGAYQVVGMLFPFVFLKDHLEWGLPRQHFDPQRLLTSAWDSLAPGGILLIANQGEAEHAEQQRLLEGCGIPITTGFRHDSLMFAYRLPRYMLVCHRMAARE